MATHWRRRAIQALASSLLVLLLACAVVSWFVTQAVYVPSSGQRVAVGPYIISTGKQMRGLCWPGPALILRCALGVPVVQVQLRDARGVPIKGETYTLLVNPVQWRKLPTDERRPTP
jgi:hypothetical protein